MHRATDTMSNDKHDLTLSTKTDSTASDAHG